jgi:hypothetical protein
MFVVGATLVVALIMVITLIMVVVPIRNWGCGVVGPYGIRPKWTNMAHYKWANAIRHTGENAIRYNRTILGDIW